MNNESQKLVFGMPIPSQNNKQINDTLARKPRLEKANRDQIILKTVIVEKLVEDDHPVRAIWEFVEKLDLNSFYIPIKAVEGVAGRNAIDPKTLISIWVYAYSKGISSAREISRLCEYDPVFQWLTGMEVINHHTLSDFRIDYKEPLDNLFTQTLGLLSAENLITMEKVMHDGTKIKANAGVDSFRREDKIQAHLKMAEEHLRSMGDPAQAPQKINEHVQKARERAANERKTCLKLALKELEKIRTTKRTKKDMRNVRVSQTDPECRIMKHSNGGYGPSYNVQISTDQSNSIIVGVQATQDAGDHSQLLPAVEKIQKNTGNNPKQMVADGGYTNRQNILKMNKIDVDFIGSMSDTSKTKASLFKKRGVEPEFYPDVFRFNPKHNNYTCSQDKILTYENKTKLTGVTEHRYRANVKDCSACSFKNKCCPTAKKGRIIVRKENHPIVESFIKKMDTEESKNTYRQRGSIAEFPNAWFKEKMNLRQFKLRGLDKVNAECIWTCLTYNIQQWIRLKWRPLRLSAVVA